MKITGLKALTFALVFVACSGFNVAHAALITHNGYTLNSDTDIVTGGGLEWLQWDVTNGQSINSALSANGMFDGRDYGTGWTLASNIQMAGLFNTFNLNSTTDEASAIQTTSPYTSGTDDTDFDRFISLFGFTARVVGDFGYLDGVDAYMVAAAFFGSDLDNDGSYNYARVLSDAAFSSQNQSNAITTQGYRAELIADFVSAQTTGRIGVALVRTAPQMDVPEPSSLAIIVLCLLGLGMRHKSHLYGFKS